MTQKQNTRTKWQVGLLSFMAIVIGIYPTIYLFIDRRFGLLASKTAAVLTSNAWNIAFYMHIFLGGIALLAGCIQFGIKTYHSKIGLHRTIGKIYVTSVLLSALSGMYIALFATGGIIAVLGFICLGMVWFGTTLAALIAIKNKNIEAHQQLIHYSYAACFAAVTLRLWLPVLTVVLHDFMLAYKIVAWLCWLPNLYVAQRYAHPKLPLIEV